MSGEPVPADYDQVASDDAAPDLRQLVVPATALEGRDVKPREWLVDNVIPKGETSLIAGPAGVGKTLLAEQIETAVALGKPLFGMQCEPANAMLWTCEDSLDELHRRQIAINRYFDVSMRDLERLQLLSFRGQDARLVTKSGSRLLRTPLYRALGEMLGDLRIGFLVLDLIADFWDGNEIVRYEVNQFVKGALGHLAEKHDCAITFLCHPSRSGLADGSGQSGSTAWVGSVRSRLYLKGEDQAGVRTLSQMKNNYGPLQTGINLEWREGALWQTDQERTETKVKPLGKYAQVALDVLRDIYAGVPIHLDTWKEKFHAEYFRRFNERSRRENFRDARQQLKSRGITDEVEGKAWPLEAEDRGT
uniref:RecA-family ATPase n=1 Tax=Haliea sp. ETY-M TaxID=1055105 RepID=A0A455R1X4_9GAMM|nr:RecA-family ATPase [Haliea sp. ETY-M]